MSFCNHALVIEDKRSIGVRFWLLAWIIAVGGAGGLIAQVEEAWRAQYDNPGGGDDIAGDLALDGSGNVYVAGSSRWVDREVFAVAKYDPEGRLLWASSCDDASCGSGDINSLGRPAVAVDGAGNAYVSGVTWDDWGCRLVTFKLDPEGRRLWVAGLWEWGESASWGEDKKRPALEVDAGGNVHVAALAEGQLRVFKYSADGQELWAAATVVSESDSYRVATLYQPVSMAVDEEGNVYAAAGDMFVKYGADGGLIWEDSTQWAEWGSIFTSIVVDRSGVYVTESDGYSFTVLKCDDMGPYWFADGPYSDGNGTIAAALGVDPADGSVYVAGLAGESDPYEWALTKYDGDGVQQWERRIEGGGGRRSFFRSGKEVIIGLDDSGSVYVTAETSPGIGNTTVKYDRDGNEIWALGPSGTPWVALAVDPHGSVYLSGSFVFVVEGPPSNAPDWDTVKYSAAGSELWSAHYDGPGGWSSDLGSSVGFDGEGNVLVLGRTAGSPLWVTLKYGSTGIEHWVAHQPASLHGWAASEGADDYPFGDLKVDPTGNAHVVGTSWSSETGFDCELVKLAPDGTELWAAHRDEGKSDYASALALGPEGSVYMASSSGPYRCCSTVAKYDGDGQELWATHSVNVGDEGEGCCVWSLLVVVVDNAGNPHLSLTYWPSWPEAPGTTILQYDSEDGHEVWRVFRVGSAIGLALDPVGNTLVAGWSGEEGVHETVKYDPGGNLLWTARFLDEGDGASALAVHIDGHIYVAGVSQESYATVKYDPDGKELWVARGPGGQPRAMALDDQGSVYVTGSAGTVKYDAEGNEVWLAGFDGEPSAIAIDATGNVCVTGSTPWRVGGRDLLTVKYVQTPEAEIARFLRGDANADGQGDLSDAIVVLDFLFLGAAGPTCMDAADVDDSGRVNITDPIYLLQHLFLGGPPPADPGLGSCGPDRTLDRLDACVGFTACE